MIETTVTEGQQHDGAIWSRSTLQPLAPEALGAFSSSLLTETVSRAWYTYYDRLGFDPTPRSRVVRWRGGRPYVNLSLSAGLDTPNAGQEPVTVRVNGQPRPLAIWVKPGFLASLKLGRGEQKIAATLAAMQTEVAALTAQAQHWLQRVQGMRWSQAEILQIMEEIERTGAASMTVYFAARHNLEYAYARLLGLIPGETSRGMALIAGALAGVPDLLEVEMARQVASLAACAAAEPAAVVWLRTPATGDWQETLPPGPFADALHAFMNQFGHRCLGEGELSQPRWVEDPTPLQQAVAACLTLGITELAPAAVSNGTEALLAAVDGKQRKEAQALLRQLRTLLPLQSRALNAYAFVLAGTRRWALGAGHEGLSDGRLRAVEDVFAYELEEVKQMMTGEWNISDRADIHAKGVERQAQLAAWCTVIASPLLVGDGEGWPSPPGLPGAVGQAEGSILAVAEPARASQQDVQMERKVILVGAQPDSGWAIWLPVAAGVAAAQGSALDPVIAAAGALGIPAVVELDAEVEALATVPGLRLDGGAGTVEAQ